MYSIVLMAAMTAGPDVPQDMLCPVTPSKYGCGFWSSHSFYDCCAPARYGWVTCWNKGFSYYPGNARSFNGACGCCPSYGHFYMPSPCACDWCGHGYGGGFGGGHNWCGCDWGIGNQPAYYTSILGCPPFLSAPPYARCADKSPCCHTMSLAFDSGLPGHTHGAGYAGMAGGYGNFGFYGAFPMQHRPTTADLPPFPRPDVTAPYSLPAVAAPMPPLPKGVLPDPIPPTPDDVEKDSKKDGSKKDKPQVQRLMPATVVLSVPDGAIVTVEGQSLASVGRERTFRTPALAPSQEYVYTVRAKVMVADREETETLQVRIVPGEINRASFEKLFARVEAATKNVVDAKKR